MTEDEPRPGFRQQLETWGPDAVRAKIMLHKFGDGTPKRTYAEAWLRVKEAEQASAVEAEKTAIARSAKDAAWVSARAAADAANKAATANRIAWAALVVAAVAAVISSIR
jgi:hypothetical protein